MSEVAAQTEGPALAAIMLVYGTYDSIRPAINCLRAQTAAGQMELLLVAPSRELFQPDAADMASFYSWQVVEVGSLSSIARGYIAGIRQAYAPLIALTQDHVYTDEAWAERLIAAHRQRRAAVVGTSIGNGNPDSLVSWADFYISYGEWAPPVSSGTERHLPGHNSCYKRSVLREYENELENLLEAESILHRRLIAQGHELWLESGTCTLHLNHPSWDAWLPKRYYQGRQFAATWAGSWSWARRLIFLAATPLIVCLRLWRLQKHIRRGHGPVFLLRLLPVSLLGLLAEGIGHTAGYAGGPGNCREKMTGFEADRLDRTRLNPGLRATIGRGGGR